MKKKVLVVGSGGREHALAWKLAQSPQVEKVYMAPGNPGTAEVGENVAIDVMDSDGLVYFALKEGIDLTVVGPDEPLANGLVDKLQHWGCLTFGPTESAAEIEFSKPFAKRFMSKRNIPTPSFQIFSDFERAVRYVGGIRRKCVVKAPGLAQGKGVYVCSSPSQAVSALQKIMVEHVHGTGSDVVIEEYIDGPEVSLHALCGNGWFDLFPPSRDYKALFDTTSLGHDDDENPNTGGMGAIVPVPGFTCDQIFQSQEIVRRITETLCRQGSPFYGCLYPGLKISPTQGMNVLEFNARFGDPEAQVYMRLLNSDLFEMLYASASGGEFPRNGILWKPGYAVCVLSLIHI
jgi:phosphoribosylamine--glycine ligase